jgi:hypothetical protein
MCDVCELLWNHEYLLGHWKCMISHLIIHNIINVLGLGLGFPLQFGSSIKLETAISTAFRHERERERERERESLREKRAKIFLFCEKIWRSRISWLKILLFASAAAPVGCKDCRDSDESKGRDVTWTLEVVRRG